MKYLRHIAPITAVLALVSLQACGSDESEEGKETSGGDGDSASGDGDGDGDGEEEETVEITSWWSAPGEAEALSALLDTHTDRNPGVNIFNSSANDGTESELSIETRLENGDPPDAFQENVHDIEILLNDFPGELASLDELFEKNGWNEAFLPEVLGAITVDGSIYAMPVGVHRENSLFMNEAIFAEHSASPPTSVPELLTLCETLSGEGVTCLATGGQGWIVRLMFFELVMGTMGGEGFRDFFDGKGDPADPKFAEAVAALRQIIDNYIDPGLWTTDGCQDSEENPIDNCLKGDSGWQEASQALFDSEAAMFMHGDWVGGYIQQLGWEAGVDYTVIGAPGASDTFMFGVDTFVLPTKAKNRDGALAFFETIGSVEGQAAFNNLKGSTPVRLDADTSLLTPVAKQALDDLSNAETVMGAPTFDKMDDKILDFANGVLTEEEFIAVFETALYL